MGALDAAQFSLFPALASALLHSLWQDALLVVAAALALGGMKRASAASRHTVGMAFLAAMALAPILQLLYFWQEPAAIQGVPVLTASRLGGAAQVFEQQSSPLAAVLVLAWLAGVGLMLVRHLGGLNAIAILERRPHERLPPAWRDRAEDLRQALGIARAVALRLSDEVVAPCTARLLRPVIWLPLSLLTRAPAAQFEALLAHELAHIARRDWLWNGVQCVIEALLFFNPAVWWLGARIRQEREHACDDLAVAACGDPVALAEALTALERSRPPRLALAAQGGSLLQRVTRLLSAQPSRGRWAGLAMLAALTVCGGLLIGQIALAGGHLPDLVVRSSTSGALGSGDYREIRANGLDGRRYYRADLDATGRLSEVYREDGLPRPIDAGVRRWLAQVSRLSVAPPVQAQQRDMEDNYRALTALVASQPAVVARLGAPAAPTGEPPNGNLRLTGTKGSADLHIAFNGPKGRAIVTVRADLRDRVWTLRRVAVR